MVVPLERREREGVKVVSLHLRAGLAGLVHAEGRPAKLVRRLMCGGEQG